MGGTGKRLELLAREALEHSRQGLMERYCGNLEDQNPERNVDNGRVFHEVSKGKRDSVVFWQRLWLYSAHGLRT